MTRGNKALAMAIAAVLTAGGHAEEIERNLEREPGWITVGAGFEYSSGDYGSSLGDTNDWYMPFSVGYSYSNWRFKLKVPYIVSTGPGNVVSSGGERVVVDEVSGDCLRSSDEDAESDDDDEAEAEIENDDCSVTTRTVVDTPGSQTASRETVSGLGDVTFAVSYGFDPFAPGMPYVDVGAKIKFPTADEDDGLGTGAYDYTLRMDLYEPIGKFALLGGVGYTFKGDIEPSGDSAGLVLDDIILGSLGAEYRLTRAWLSGVSVDYTQASSEFSEDAWDLTGYLNWRSTEGLSLTGTLGTGFTNGSAELVGGLSIIYGFNSPF